MEDTLSQHYPRSEPHLTLTHQIIGQYHRFNIRIFAITHEEDACAMGGAAIWIAVIDYAPGLDRIAKMLTGLERRQY